MIRFISFLTVVVLLGLLGTWLMEHSGVVSMTWFGYRIDTSSTVALLAVVAAAFAMALVFMFLVWLSNVPKRFSKLHAYKKRETGLVALTQGFAAIAAGDSASAQKLSYKAVQCLGETPLTLLLQTQTAQLTGNDETPYLTSLAQHKETEIIALKGLLLAARKNGDSEQATALAEKIYQRKPNTSGISQILVDLYRHKQEWKKARHILEEAIKHHRMDIAKAKHDLGVLLLAESEALLSSGQPAVAYHTLKHAQKYVPDSVPLAVYESTAFRLMDKKRKAAHRIENAWRAMPHPDLAHAYLELFKEEPPAKQLKRIESLASLYPDHPESLLVAAHAAVAAEMPDKARYYLARLLPEHQTVRAYQLMAAMEKQSGKPEAAQAWLAKTVEAKPDPAWVCNLCRFTAATWVPTCPNCHGFDSFTWSEGTAAYQLQAA